MLTARCPPKAGPSTWAAARSRSGCWPNSASSWSPSTASTISNICAARRQRELLDRYGAEAVAGPAELPGGVPEWQSVRERLAELLEARPGAAEADALRPGLAEMASLEPQPGEDAALVAERSGRPTPTRCGRREIAHEALGGDRTAHRRGRGHPAPPGAPRVGRGAPS